MGFIRAALSSGLNSFNDSKFKEAIVLPNNLTADALAIKGQLLSKDPDGKSRQSNQNTGLLTDGSVVIVPQCQSHKNLNEPQRLAKKTGYSS